MNPLDGILEDGSVDWPRALLVALAVTTAIAVGAVASTSTGAFEPYNDDWDGATAFRDAVESDPDVDGEILLDAREYDGLEAEGTVAFVVAPAEGYDDAADASVREFVTRGGTLVVLENFGEPGNDLLADVGATARVDGGLLRDERHNHRGPAMPVATPDGDALPAVEEVRLNYASAIDPGEASVLVATSEFAYLGDEDGGLEAGTELGSRPVATTESVGDGRVVAVADPSVTTNAMLEEGDNAAFLAALYADADRVVLDRSSAESLPPLSAALVTLRASHPLQVLVGVAAVAAVAAVSSGRVGPHLERLRDRLRGGRTAGVGGVDSPDGPGPGLSTAERTEFLRRRHPEWNEARIRRVARVAARDDVDRAAPPEPNAATDRTGPRADPTRRHDE